MPSSLAGGNRLFCITQSVPAASIGTDYTLFIAPWDCTVQAASETHATAGSDGGAVVVQLTKDTGTNAPGAGTDLLANTSNTGFNLKGTANTPQHATFKAGASRKLAKGDRIGVDWSGTMTAVAGVAFTVTLNRLD